MQRGGRDRYSSLLRTLQAGQELPWQQQRRGRRITWHPIAGTLLRVALVGVLLYFGVTAAIGLWRDSRVEVWAGPDASVTSGQRLEGCALISTETIRPMGFQPDADFPPTGYTLGTMTLYRIANTPEGQSGNIVAVKLETSAVGRIFRATPDCS